MHQKLQCCTNPALNSAQTKSRNAYTMYACIQPVYVCVYIYIYAHYIKHGHQNNTIPIYNVCPMYNLMMSRYQANAGIRAGWQRSFQTKMYICPMGSQCDTIVLVLPPKKLCMHEKLPLSQPQCAKFRG